MSFSFVIFCKYKEHFSIKKTAFTWLRYVCISLQIKYIQ
nr:MAG TPA: hypothetical protein [Caudoviricetes sp.]